MSAESSVCVALYENERHSSPTKSGKLSLVKVTSLLSKRSIRAEKTGLAIGFHRLRPGGVRRNADVMEVTALVGDFDGGGTLEEVRTKLEGLSYISHSTHNHNPAEGRNKFRVIVFISRPISADEYAAAWTGFNELMGGSIDRACKDASRLYYLPSCPLECSEHAFYEAHDGRALTPEELIGAARPSTLPALKTTPSDLASFSKTYTPETTEEIERVRSALTTVPADCEYERWRNVLWALSATGWQCAEELGRTWSKSAQEKYEEAAFEKAWGSYDPAHAQGIGLGTLFHYARDAGWVDQRALVESAHGAAGDIRNGQLFAELWRDKRLFVHETGDCLRYDTATGWLKGGPQEEVVAAKEVVQRMRDYAAEQWKAKPEDARTKRLMAHVDRSSNENKIRSMIELAKSEPGMTITLSELDCDPMVLGVQNGVLDLAAGALLAPTPRLLVTKRCNVEFDREAKAPTWTAFLERVMSGQPEQIAYLQRLAGYLLSGDVSEQCFAFLYGLGANGKTTFIETLRWLSGTYAVGLPSATLMVGKRDPGAAAPDLMMLKGARLAVASETEEGARLAEAQIKSLTGGDAITARNPYGLYATWPPTHKLVMVGNHRPIITGGDHGIWRRVHLVPFTQTIPEAQRDPALQEKLRAEGPGILNWALEGLREWRRIGLAPPPEVKAAGAEYRADMDIIGQWLEEHTEPAPQVSTKTSECYRAYQAWARAAGWHPMTRQAFGRRLSERGIHLVKSGGEKRAVGLKLNDAGRAAF